MRLYLKHFKKERIKGKLMYYFNLKFSAPYFIIGICCSSFSWFTVPENPYLASSQAFFWAPVWNISFSYTAFRPTFSSLAAPHKQEVHLKCCKQASFYIKYEASFTVALHEGVSTQPSTMVLSILRQANELWIVNLWLLNSYSDCQLIYSIRERRSQQHMSCAAHKYVPMLIM